MKQVYVLIFLLCFAATGQAQSCRDYAVELTAATQVSTPRITLKWKLITGVTSYAIFKKAKTGTAWGSALATVAATDSLYADNAVIVDSAYEYKVVGYAGSFTAAGYIYAGIKCPAQHNRGGLVLIVDSTFSDSCASDILTYMKDLRGDGWQVIRHDVSRTMKDTGVKALIKYDYDNIANIKAVMLLGHVAVPYSGDLNPDAHPDHLGAWPADVYYARLTAVWTDATVNDTVASYPANDNIPGDGKWDANGYTSRSELQVARVDFYNMPAFAATEVQMMRSYLSKDHIYKMDSLAVRRRALISDNFGAFSGEAFAANGWRNFSPLVSRDSVAPLPFISSLNTGSYQWAYGCGGGSFSSAGGIGTTTDFTTNNMNGIFTILFGSYFGDWNVTNNFLRAPLCSPTPALTSCWAGRPNWFFHHMALGENIGYSAWHSQNNNGTSLYYPGGYGTQWVHIALMGDLSLRADYIKPPANLAITPVAVHGANLSWTASPDTGVIGYYVYRATAEYGSYARISPMVTTTAFSDTVGADGLKYYLVRPVKLQYSPSGYYYNLGIGIVDSATVTYSHVGMAEVAASMQVQVYPNPATDRLSVIINADAASDATMSIVDVAGHVSSVATRSLQQGANTYSVNISELPAGIYFVQVRAGAETYTTKWVKL